MCAPISVNMGSHMKTTIDISDLLLRQAKALVRKKGITLRELVEQGLKMALRERQVRPAAFKLQDASVSGKGLQPDAAAMSWEQIRYLSYQGHGG